MVAGYVLTMYGAEGVGAIYPLFIGEHWVYTDYLAEAAQIVCIGCIPDFFVAWVFAQLAMLEFFSSGMESVCWGHHTRGG